MTLTPEQVREAHSIECDHCGVPAGEGCVTDTGFPCQQPHAGRRRYATRPRHKLTDYG
jgi:hypothetical protein